MEKKQPLSNHDIHELQQRIADYEDAAAYKKLFFHFFLPLKSFSYSILKSKEIAEEAVSDVFIEIWSRRKQLMEIDDLRIYLYIAVRNISLRRLQQTQKTSMLSLDDLAVEFASLDPNAETFLITGELAQKIEMAIESLPQQCKIIFKMAKQDNLRYKEIAKLLNISVKTIDNQLSTALKKIATALQTSPKKPSAN
ncbi:MAG: RNA polymerase sigma-70 factor [Bacteroidetes bacterium]|nr:RNA polymerase sigma-70 factor [Bacteroidota bacterium]